MAYRQYQVVTCIPEDDEWEEQEMVSGVLGLEAAIIERDRPIGPHLPEGTSRYIEVRTVSSWGRL